MYDLDRAMYQLYSDSKLIKLLQQLIELLDFQTLGGMKSWRTVNQHLLSLFLIISTVH